MKIDFLIFALILIRTVEQLCNSVHLHIHLEESVDSIADIIERHPQHHQVYYYLEYLIGCQGLVTQVVENYYIEEDA